MVERLLPEDGAELVQDGFDVLLGLPVDRALVARLRPAALIVLAMDVFFAPRRPEVRVAAEDRPRDRETAAVPACSGPAVAGECCT